MARAGLKDHPKFRRLVYLLKEPIPHVWGYLECLWATAYQRRSDLIGDKIDVELSAEFPGDCGKLVDALHQTGFIDLVEGVYFVHDLVDHAPPYVRRGLQVRQFGRPLVSEIEQQVDLNDQSDDFRLTIGRQEKSRVEEEKSREEESPQPPLKKTPTESDPSWLARHWLFARKGAHTEHDRKAADNFADLIATGVSAEKILVEIKRAGRLKTEPIWEFCKRLSPAKGRAPPSGMPGSQALLEEAKASGK